MKLKRIISKTGVLFLTVLLPRPAGVVPAAFAEEDAPEMGQVTADKVNLRKEPNTDCEILAEVPGGTEVEVLGKDGTWYRVLYEGSVVGYIRQDYLFVNSTGSRGAYVKSDGAALRGGPSEDSYVIAELTVGQGVRVRALLEGEWFYASANDQSGYVHRSYLEITSSSTASIGMLKQGMEGEEVEKLQNALYDRGFLSKSGVTSMYSSETRKAVLEFQQACGLSADGIAGAETLNSIYDSNNEIEKDNADFYKLKGSVVLLDWFEGGDEWLHKGSKFTVIDVRTGKSFRAQRFGGWYHADSEPITKSDTLVMKSLEGFSWNRRPIWITYRGRTVAASMHTMPHMANPTQSNGFDGHFCIHLDGSKVHENSKECPRHQACVYEAYKAGRAS